MLSQQIKTLGFGFAVLFCLLTLSLWQQLSQKPQTTANLPASAVSQAKGKGSRQNSQSSAPIAKNTKSAVRNPFKVTSELAECFQQFRSIRLFGSFGQEGRTLLKTLRQPRLLNTQKLTANRLLTYDDDAFEMLLTDLEKRLPAQTTMWSERTLSQRMIRILSERLRVKAWYFFHQDQGRDALEQLCRLLKVLRELRARTFYVDTREALNDALSKASAALRRLASRLNQKQDLMNTAITELHQCEVQNQEFRDFLSAQRQQRSSDLAQVPSGQSCYLLDRENDSGQQKLRPFQKQQTKLWFNKFFTLAHQALDSVTAFEELKNFGEGFDKDQRLWRQTKNNQLGIQFLDRLYLDLFSQLSIQRRLLNAKLRLSQMVLAAHIFRLENQRLPKSLAEVNQQLPASRCVDPYGGAALKFSVEDTFMYTIGPNEIDNEGGLDDWCVQLELEK